MSAPGRPPFKVVVFFDELNTCRNVCLIAEVFAGTLDGELLPENMYFVGAINPLRSRPAPGAGAGTWAPLHVGVAGAGSGARVPPAPAAERRGFNPNTGQADDEMEVQVVRPHLLLRRVYEVPSFSPLWKSAVVVNCCSRCRCCYYCCYRSPTS
jgi:hypothetical protein